MASRMLGKSFVALTLAFMSTSGEAAQINGTDFDVIYNPSTLGLFGSLSLIGDTLEFTPNDFKALSTNGQGVATPTGGATTASGIQLVAHPGFQFGGLQLTEFGDYLLSGVGSSVSVSGELIAFDGSAAANPVLTYTTSTIAANAALPLNLNTGTSQNWSASASVDNTTSTVSGGSASWLSKATTVNISLENLLSASTSASISEALIEKKAAFGSVGLTVTPIPLPPAIWLFASSIVAMGFRSTSRRRDCATFG